MAYEAVCAVTPVRFARYTVSTAADIPKGSHLAITSPNTAAITTADNDVFGGIAWEEKNSSDNASEIVAALDGTWIMKASAAGSITVGHDVTVDSPNQIKIFTTNDHEIGLKVGQALESISTTGGYVAVRLNV